MQQQLECVSLQVCVSVLGPLESVVRRCLGPEGGSVLFTRDTGETLISRHGQRVLSTLHLEHPMARMVLDCVCAHAKSTGDGTKSFILLLSALLQAIQDSTHMRSKASWNNPALQNLANRLLALGRNELDDIIIHQITPYASSYCSHHSDKLEHSVLDLLISGYISGRTGAGQAEILKRILCEFYSKSRGDQNTTETISFIHAHFDLLHTRVTGLPIGCSEVIEGLVVTRDWSVWTALQDPIKALVLYESFGSSLGDDITICFQQDWLSRTESITKQKLARLLELQVNVMLSSVKQPECVLQWARMNHVALLECVDLDQLDFLCNISILETLCHPQHIVPLKYCKRLQLGGLHCAQLGIYSNAHTLVLCAPAPGLLDQTVCVSRGVFAMLQHTTRTLASNQSQSSPVDQSQCAVSSQDVWGAVMHAGGVLPVGGVFEFMLHHYLLTRRTSDPESCRLLAEALLCVPRALYAHNHRRFLNIQTCFINDLRKWDRTSVGDPVKFEFGFSEGLYLESVSGKQQLVVSVLECLHRLLSVGAILYTRSPLRPRIYCEEEEEEEVHSNSIQ